MNIGEFADFIKIELIIRRLPARDVQKNQFICYFLHSNIIDDGVSKAVCGHGHTIKKALQDYVKQIRGKDLVVHRYFFRTKKYHVPYELSPEFRFIQPRRLTLE